MNTTRNTEPRAVQKTVAPEASKTADLKATGRKELLRWEIPHTPEWNARVREEIIAERRKGLSRSLR